MKLCEICNGIIPKRSFINPRIRTCQSKECRRELNRIKAMDRYNKNRELRLAKARNEGFETENLQKFLCGRLWLI